MDYGLGVITAAIQGRLAKSGLYRKSPRFRFQSARLASGYPFTFQRTREPTGIAAHAVSREPTETLTLSLLVALCVVRFWLMPLPTGFWVDESVTAFVVNNPHDPSFAVAPQVPLSIYYQLPRFSTAVLGSYEIAYRLPSLLMAAIALCLIARLAARLIHPDAAWFVVLACFSLRGLNFEAIDARPYALGILVASASVLFLVRWLDTARWIDALWFVIAAAVLWRVQLAFWPFYGVYGIYAAARLTRRETEVRVQQLLAVFFAIGLLLLPVAREALSLLSQAGAHVIAKLPTQRDLRHGVEFSFVALCPVAAWLLRRLLGRHDQPVRWSASSLCLCLSWWLVAPVAIFAFSWITGNRHFCRALLLRSGTGRSVCSRGLERTLPSGPLVEACGDRIWNPAFCFSSAIGLRLGQHIPLRAGVKLHKRLQRRALNQKLPLSVRVRLLRHSHPYGIRTIQCPTSSPVIFSAIHSRGRSICFRSCRRRTPSGLPPN